MDSFFLMNLQISCQAALHRLDKVGVPATTEHHTTASPLQSALTKHVAETVQVLQQRYQIDHY